MCLKVPGFIHRVMEIEDMIQLTLPEEMKYYLVGF